MVGVTIDFSEQNNVFLSPQHMSFLFPFIPKELDPIHICRTIFWHKCQQINNIPLIQKKNKK